MSDIVIINPSSNMRTMARELSTYGRRVECVRASGLPYMVPERVFYFFAGCRACFTEDVQDGAEKEERIFLFRRSVISRFRMWGVSKNLGMLNPGLIKGNFTDLIMFRRRMLRSAVSHKGVMKEFSGVDAVRRSYPDAVIVASMFPGWGNIKLIRWETDFDLAETFGRDYFIFFNGTSRLEAFCKDGWLFTMSKEKKHIDQLAKIVPSIVKFTFKPLEEKNVMKNHCPWIIRNPYPKVTLVNDYSFFDTSIDMPPSWYGRLAAAINFKKNN